MLVCSCNTLFVANVPADTTEAELSQIFGACAVRNNVKTSNLQFLPQRPPYQLPPPQGFKRLRLSAMRGAVTAFVGSNRVSI
jgi:hypothetical protein